MHYRECICLTLRAILYQDLQPPVAHRHIWRHPKNSVFKMLLSL